MTEKIVEKAIKPTKEVKSLEDLKKENWKYTYSSFAPHLKVYGRGEDRLIYNTNNQTIEHRYFEKIKK